MKSIYILALEDSLINCIDSVIQIYNRVNDFLTHSGKESFYNIEIIADSKKVSLNNNTYQIKASKLISEDGKADLVFLPIICGDLSKIIKKNEKYHNWLITQYNAGCEIASLCVGTYFLASTGLLNGKKCATHWAMTNEFRQKFPSLNILDGKIITDEDGIYTSGGNYSYLNLLLYLIEKDLGHEMAVLTAKMFEIEIDRKDQFEYYIFQSQKNHKNELVKKVQEFIEANYESKITTSLLSDKFCIGKRTLERNFKKNTGNTIFEYIQRVRVEQAKRLLENSEMSINEVIYSVGYSDITAFRLLFKKQVNMSPMKYHKKYRQREI